MPWGRHDRKSEIRTAKGDEFEPSSLKTIHSPNEVLTGIYGKNAGFSVIRDEEFPNANKALDAKVKFLKKPGKRKKLNAVEKGFTPVYTYFATTICHFACCIETLK